MSRSGALLGGEPSGHVIFSDFRLSGDGLLTTLKVAEAIAADRASFDDMARDWVQAPQLLKNIRVKQKVPLETLPAIQAEDEGGAIMSCRRRGVSLCDIRERSRFCA